MNASGSSANSNRNFIYFSLLSFSSTEISWSWPFSVPIMTSFVEAVFKRLNEINRNKSKCTNISRKLLSRESKQITFCNQLSVPGNSIHNKTFQFAQKTRLVPFSMSVKSISTPTTNNGGNTVATSRINKNPVDSLLPRTARREINVYNQAETENYLLLRWKSKQTQFPSSAHLSPTHLAHIFTLNIQWLLLQNQAQV